MPINISRKLKLILQRLRTAERRFQRAPGSVALLAVSKMQSVNDILSLAMTGQTDFAENYLQEALPKIAYLPTVTWHYIGSFQSRKARGIAEHFDWVHTVTRLSEAKKLSEARAPHAPPLQVCIQIKLDNNPHKPGILPQEACALAEKLVQLPHLQLRGLMAMPPYSDNFSLQRTYFSTVRTLFETLQQKGLSLDTLSMGTTHDLEAAIAEGATLVRVGTGLFGLRKTP